MPFEDKKIREKEERRKEIIDAAEKHFFSKGYDKVRMDDIAREVKVNKALLYYYFEDKDSLYFEVALRGARIFNGMVREAICQECTGLKKLRAIGRVYFEFSLKYPDYFNVNYDFGSYRFILKEHEVASEHKELTSELQRICYEAALQGVEDGSIRKGLNPVEVVSFLGHASEGLVKTKYFMKDLESQGISYEQFIEDSLDMLDHAIKSTNSARD